LAPAAEHEGVPALEAHHAPALARPLDQQPVDLLLAERAAALTAHVKLDVGSELLEQRARYQAIGDHHLGAPQRVVPAHRDQPRIAGAGANQHHGMDHEPTLARRARPVNVAVIDCAPWIGGFAPRWPSRSSGAARAAAPTATARPPGAARVI